jgi:hypothetical protein
VHGGGSCATVNVAVAVTGNSVDVEVGTTVVGMNVPVGIGVNAGAQAVNARMRIAAMTSKTSSLR